jgi:hypothetical protein
MALQPLSLISIWQTRQSTPRRQTRCLTKIDTTGLQEANPCLPRKVGLTTGPKILPMLTITVKMNML